MALTHVVVAVDFSPLADVALARAIAIAARHGARVTLVYAEAELGAESAAAAPVFTGDLATAVRTAATDEHEARRARVEAAGLAVTVARRAGAAVDVVPDAAAELGCELLVLGTHGRTGVRRFLLGSVAERVARRASCDVLIVRDGDGVDGAGAPGAFQRPIVATDFSDSADLAIAAAHRLAAPGVELEVVHAWSYPVGTWGVNALGVARATTAVRDAIVAAAEEQGAALVARHAAHAPLRFSLLEGGAADAVTEHAAAVGADLIALGTHGHRGLHRLLLGSVAETTLRHAPCSVLVCHRPER
ncbi:MAG: universal stress protein [Kofleriaceae bacterium]